MLSIQLFEFKTKKLYSKLFLYYLNTTSCISVKVTPIPCKRTAIIVGVESMAVIEKLKCIFSGEKCRRS